MSKIEFDGLKYTTAVPVQPTTSNSYLFVMHEHHPENELVCFPKGALVVPLSKERMSEQSTSKQELAQQILAIIQKANDEAIKVSETFAQDLLNGALDDIEKLCKESK